MVSPQGKLTRGRAGFATLELVVAMGILVAVILPVAFSITSEQRLARNYYFRAIAMEIVDGELEVLAAGEWSGLPIGTQAYRVRGEAQTNLPPGQFLASRDEHGITLQWRPAQPGRGGPVLRAVSLERLKGTIAPDP